MATILVVDDEAVFCELLKTLLKSHGHEVLTANSGREALEIFKRHRPQFTMLDLRMPEMSGLEVLKQIRAIDSKAAVMILTAWGSDALELQARRLGVTDFLSKSLSLDTIMASLQRGLIEPAKAAYAPKPPEEMTGGFGAYAALAGSMSPRCNDAMMVSKESDLLRKSVTPSLRACSSKASDPHAVRIITAALLSIARICFKTSSPLISGMRRSSIVNWGRCRLNISRASRPLFAVRTSWP